MSPPVCVNAIKMAAVAAPLYNSRLAKFHFTLNQDKLAVPLVRRVFGQLLASELVAVQPMSLPSGLLFFLDFKYDRN